MFHLLRFYSGEGKPVLLSRGESGEVGCVGLSQGSSADISFGDLFCCIGYRTPEKYIHCPNKATHTRQCPTCAARDVAKAYTVGDFSGYPALYAEAQHEQYCLYLAQFGEEITKCGVTRKERFSERMREQGADFGCVIASFIGPDEVYGAESAVQSRFSFANSVRLAQKLRLISFDSSVAKERISSSVELVRSSGILPDFTPQIEDFSQHYPRVRNVRQTYSVLGEILGAKGEILLFRSDSGKDFAVNMRSKVGSFFSMDGQ